MRTAFASALQVVVGNDRKCQLPVLKYIGSPHTWRELLEPGGLAGGVYPAQGYPAKGLQLI